MSCVEGKLPAIIRDPAYEKWRWRIFGITWLAYAGFYLTRKSFSVAKIGIGEGTDIGFTQAQFALIDGAFLVTYAIGQFVCGIAGDYLGPRRVIFAGLLLSVVAAVGMGLSSLVGAFIFFFAVQGIAQSSGWAPLTKNISCFFSQRERGVIMGAWCTNYAVGGFVASIFAGYVGQRLGWRYAFLIPAGALLLIALLFLMLQVNCPEDAGLPPIEEYHHEEPVRLANGSIAEPTVGSWAILREVASNRIVILLTLVYFCLKPARYAILFWGPKYVHDRLGTGMAESGFVSAMFELAGPLSIFLGGWISDKVFGSRRMPVSVICLLTLSVVLFLLNKMPVSSWVLGGSLFIIGFLLYAPDSLVSGTAAVDFGTKQGAATAAGLINGFGSIGAIVGGTIPGFFQKQWGWDGVFTFLAVTVLIAGLLLLPQWNALPQNVRKK